MSKLLSVAMRDFRQHDRSAFNFTPTVNVLVGANEAGKSTVLNAIRWVVFNRPLGESVVRWGAKGCAVRLITETCEVVRSRGSENVYVLDGGSPFKAVGSDVPREVKLALQLDEINFQRQIEGPFWLTLSAPEIAREMNRVVDLSVIDWSMSNAGTRLREANTQVTVLTGMLSEARQRVGRLRWVTEVEKEAEEALRCEQDAAAKRSEAETISRVVSQIEEAQAQSYAIPDLSKVQPLIRRLHEIRLQVGSLNKLIDRIEDEEADLCALRREIEKAEREAITLKPETCEACGQPLPGGRG